MENWTIGSKPALVEQNAFLTTAYRQMTEEGRDALDRLVGQLAETDREVAGVLPQGMDTGQTGGNL